MRTRRYAQLAAALGANAYVQGFLAKTLYQGRAKGVCVPVLNCYACPSALFSCPIGAIQHFMVLHRVPYYVLGSLGAVGALVGRMPCGTLCPFGFLQELLYKVPSVKIALPRYVRPFPYLFLISLVFVVPWFSGESWFSKLCPVGTLMGGVPWVVLSPDIRALVRDLFWIKMAILLFFLASSVVARRPFCQTSCPLGALLGLFNRLSFLRLHWDADRCTHCDKCLAVCPMEIRVYEGANTGHCIRCLDCTACEAITVTTVFSPEEGGEEGGRAAAGYPAGHPAPR
ncbi:MAG: 4Fe-4S binding protein [Deferrisomatales bacterium]